MKNIKHDSGKNEKSTVNILAGYFEEMFTEPAPISISEQTESQNESTANVSASWKEIVFPPPIAKDHCLVPTIKLYSDERSKKIRSKEESMLILLNNLYFLRRPLPPKVRQSFLDLSEQMLEDYQSAGWETQVIKTGVLCES